MRMSFFSGFAVLFLAVLGIALLAFVLRPVHVDTRSPAAIEALEQTDIFLSGTEGYHTFRIPALIATVKGTLLAFAEGRKGSSSDTGDIDIVLRRSLDGGETWEPMQVVADDGPNTIGNPCPVVDRDTGTIWLPLTRNLGEDKEDKIKDRTGKESRTVWMTKSTDDGATWEKPWEITETTKDPDWTWYATGPGNGIQLKSGRLVVPCDHALVGSEMYRSHAIYSDDHGETWQLGGTIGENVNECQVVERGDGSLLMNMRSYHGNNRRCVATSLDGGLTWTQAIPDDELVEPVCQASLIRLPSKENDGKSRLLFSNPASTERVRMTVRLSYDEGVSWPVSRLLDERPSAYSSLAVLPDGKIGCLYERGEESAYEKITFARFSLGWLTDGKDSL